MKSFPPLGMASRALTARFMTTCSIWPGSTLTRPRSGFNLDYQRHVFTDQAAKHLFDIGKDACLNPGLLVPALAGG